MPVRSATASSARRSADPSAPGGLRRRSSRGARRRRTPPRASRRPRACAICRPRSGRSPRRSSRRRSARRRRAAGQLREGAAPGVAPRLLPALGHRRGDAHRRPPRGLVRDPPAEHRGRADERRVEIRGDHHVAGRRGRHSLRDRPWGGGAALDGRADRDVGWLPGRTNPSGRDTSWTPFISRSFSPRGADLPPLHDPGGGLASPLDASAAATRQGSPHHFPPLGPAPRHKANGPGKPRAPGRLQCLSLDRAGVPRACVRGEKLPLVAGTAGGSSRRSADARRRRRVACGERLVAELVEQLLLGSSGALGVHCGEGLDQALPREGVAPGELLVTSAPSWWLSSSTRTPPAFSTSVRSEAGPGNGGSRCCARLDHEPEAVAARGDGLPRLPQGAHQPDRARESPERIRRPDPPGSPPRRGRAARARRATAPPPPAPHRPSPAPVRRPGRRPRPARPGHAAARRAPGLAALDTWRDEDRHRRSAQLPCHRRPSRRGSSHARGGVSLVMAPA